MFCYSGLKTTADYYVHQTSNKKTIEKKLFLMIPERFNGAATAKRLGCS